MVYLRFALILLLVLAFVLIGLPLDALAQRFNWPVRVKIPLVFHRVLIWILHIRVHQIGEICKSPAILVPNHVSWTDICVIGALTPLCFVAKKDVASWPVFGVLARAQGSVFVDRERRMQVHKTNLEMAGRLQDARSIVLFPEGTTGDGLRLLKFHTSHFAAAREFLRQNPKIDSVRLQPVVVLYERRHGMVMDRLTRTQVAWYGDTALLPHLLFLLRLGPLDVTLRFLEPVLYQRGTNRKLIAQDIAQQIRRENYAILYKRVGES
eukprot:gene16404-16582_t